MAIDDGTAEAGARWGRQRIIVLAIVLAASALALWACLAAALGLRSISAARADVERVQAQLEDGDTVGAADSLRALAGHGAGIDRWLGGAPWSWGTWLPIVGDTLAATTTMASAAGGVVEPLAPAAAAVLEAPSGDLATVAAAVQQQSAGFIAAGRTAAAAAPELAAIDPDGLLWPLAAPIAAGQQRIADALPGVTGMAAASVLIPGLFGIDGPTQWLLVASQPAEARGSGAGFFGAYGVMQGDAGQLQLIESRPNNDLFDRPVDLSILPPEFEQLWGRPAAFIRGHNLTRHFPYAAQLLVESASSLGADPAYVVALDPTVVAGLLAVTGPVTAAGVTIDADNCEEFLTSGIYRQFPDPVVKDEVALQLMSAVLVALQTATPDLGALASALAEPLQQQRLVAWASDPAQQQVVELSVVAGALPSAPLTLTAAINNGGGNKLDAYLRSEVLVELQGSCGGPAAGRVSLTLTMDDVPRGLPGYVVDGYLGPDVYGGNRTLVHVYGPPGAYLDTFTIDGQTALVVSGSELLRPVWGAEVDLVPGQSRTLEVVFRGDLPDEPLDYLVQPMIHDTSVTLRDERAC